MMPAIWDASSSLAVPLKILSCRQRCRRCASSTFSSASVRRLRSRAMVEAVAAAMSDADGDELAFMLGPEEDASTDVEKPASPRVEMPTVAPSIETLEEDALQYCMARRRACENMVRILEK